MLDIVRDSTVGQLINWVTRGALLPYADQRFDYELPVRYLQEGQLEKKDEDGSSHSTNGKPDGDPFILVSWEGDHDPDRPINWSMGKRYFIIAQIMLLTFAVYIAGSAYFPSVPGLEEEFGVSAVVATLGVTFFVLAYGFGPIFLSPLQEVPAIGRNPPYLIGLLLFCIFQIPPIFAKNIATVLIFRLLAGFVGSPALATGGASIGDILPPHALPYAISAWSMAAIAGPVIGPIMAAFAVQARGWKWPFYEMLIISGFATIVLGFFLPETLESSILLRRAKRLRKLTGNENLRAQWEIDGAGEKDLVREVGNTIIVAFKLCLVPAILFANVYMGLLYSIFYLWFESVPLCFVGIYNFSMGQAALPFIGFLVTATLTVTCSTLYYKYHMVPRIQRTPDLPPETGLELGIVGACFVPVAMLVFGWTARENVHWIVPTIGASLIVPANFLIFQSIVVYAVSFAPKNMASVLASNALFRSTLAGVFPLFGRAMFINLGIGGGSSILAGVAALLIPGFWVLYKYGARLRAKSKWIASKDRTKGVKEVV